MLDPDAKPSQKYLLNKQKGSLTPDVSNIKVVGKKQKVKNMNINYFKKELAPNLKEYKLTYSSFPNGDFGSLERVVIERNNKIAGIDFWSKGWLEIDIYDLVVDDQIMNLLLDPSEFQEQNNAIKKFIEILLKED